MVPSVGWGGDGVLHKPGGKASGWEWGRWSIGGEAEAVEGGGSTKEAGTRGWGQVDRSWGAGTVGGSCWGVQALGGGAGSSGDKWWRDGWEEAKGRVRLLNSHPLPLWQCLPYCCS